MTIKKPPIHNWKPRPWQQQVIDSQKPVTAIRCSRRAGKTDLCAYIAGTSFLTSENCIEICIASFALNNAKAVVWTRLIGLLSPLPPYIQHVKSENMLINKKIGSTIKLFGLSSEHGDKVRGHSFDLAILDEYSLIPYDIFTNAFLPTLMDRNGWLMCICTPRGSFDLMAMIESECDDPNNKETHVRFHFPASSLIGQVPNLTEKFLETQKRRNALTYALEFEADSSASGMDTIFDQPLLIHAVCTDSPCTDPNLAVSAGLDFAPRRDKCVLAVRNSQNFINLIELSNVRLGFCMRCMQKK